MTALNNMADNGITQEQAIHFSPITKGFAWIVSIIFHPLFMPFYLSFFLVKTHPFAFASMDHKHIILMLGSIVLNTIIFPAVTVLLLKQLKFIPSFLLKTSKERIIPYAAIMIFYFWVFKAMNYQDDIPVLLTRLLLGNFIIICMVFMENIFIKVSMHTMGMGGAIGLMLTLIGDRFFQVSPWLMITIFLAGLVATCRMILGAHTNREIYWGFATGIIAQLIAFWIL